MNCKWMDASAEADKAATRTTEGTTPKSTGSVAAGLIANVAYVLAAS